jgi:hypothetical protein
MGTAYSSNIVKTSTSVYTEVLTKYTQNCYTHDAQANVIKVCAKGDVIIDKVTQKNVAKVDIKCMSDISSDTKVQTKLDEITKQLAEATVQALGMGSTEAHNITESYKSLSTSIKKSFAQECIPSTSQTNIFSTCDPSVVPDNVYLIDFNQQNTVDTMVKCVQRVADKTEALQDIKTQIDQAAKAKVEGPLGWLFLVAFIVLVVIITMGAGGATGKGFTGLIIGVIIVVAIWYCLWMAPFGPFNSKKKK